MSYTIFILVSQCFVMVVSNAKTCLFDLQGLIHPFAPSLCGFKKGFWGALPCSLSVVPLLPEHSSNVVYLSLA